MDANAVVLVLTTWPAGPDPTPFASALIEERLAACVNILPAMESVYRWKERVELERERQILIKTTGARLDALKQRIASLHPYDVPEILAIEVTDGAATYLDWVRASTGEGEAGKGTCKRQNAKGEIWK